MRRPRALPVLACLSLLAPGTALPAAGGPAGREARAASPAPLPALSPAPGAQTFRLPTGLTCLLVENHERPLVRMELTVPVPPALEPMVRKGTLGLLARVLETTGAGTYSRADYNRAADELGLQLAFEGRRDAFRWRVLTDSRSQEAALELLANAVFRPVLDSPAIETQRQALIKKAGATPLREEAMDRFLWAIQDPGALQVPKGVGLDHLELPEVLALHQALVRPEGAVLVLYGDLSLAQARQLALLHLGVWGPSPAPAGPQATVPALAVPRFSALLDGGAVAELWAGAVRRGTGRPEVEALLPVLLEGISLTPFDGLDLTVSLQPSGPMLLKATGRDAARATLVGGLAVALDLLRTRGFSEGDLDRAKVRWRARRATRTLHPESLVRRLPLEAEAVAEGAVEALTPEAVNGALATWLEPEGMRFLLLGGDAAMLQAGEKAGLGKAVLIKP